MTAANDFPLVLAIGDSLTAGYGLRANEGFARQLELRLRAKQAQARVINAGVSGDTSADALRRLPRILSSLVAKPDLALVELGANDFLRNLPPLRFEANMATIVEQLHRCGISVLLATVEPPAFLARFAAGYSSAYRNVAGRFNVQTCPFFPPDVLGHPEMVLPDRVHPNARAIALCADAVAPCVTAAIERAATFTASSL